MSQSSLREKWPNKEIFLVRIQSEYSKIRTRKNSVFGHFSRSAYSALFAILDTFSLSWMIPELKMLAKLKKIITKIVNLWNTNKTYNIIFPFYCILFFKKLIVLNIFLGWNATQSKNQVNRNSHNRSSK